MGICNTLYALFLSQLHAEGPEIAKWDCERTFHMLDGDPLQRPTQSQINTKQSSSPAKFEISQRCQVDREDRRLMTLRSERLLKLIM